MDAQGGGFAPASLSERAERLARDKRARSWTCKDCARERKARIVRTAPSVKPAARPDPSGSFFAIPHFDGYKAVLVRLCHLDRLTMQELSEVITGAWLCRAPKRMAKAYLAERVT